MFTVAGVTVGVSLVLLVDKLMEIYKNNKNNKNNKNEK
jgi:hypothetical protein